MNPNMYRSGLTLLLLMILAPRQAQAAPIIAGSTLLPGTAIQDLTLLPNTPFNPTNSPILIRDRKSTRLNSSHRR